jgi:hypothetical protein
MITPDDVLIVLFALLTLATYGLWVAGRLPGTRKLFTFLAIVSLVTAVVFYDLKVSKMASNDSAAEKAPTDPTNHAAGSIDGGGA